MSTFADLSDTEAADQFERDLRWVMESPDLLDSSMGAGSLGSAGDAARVIDRVELAEFLRERGDLRVGHYFENLVCYWLKYVRQVEMVAHRQQVVVDGRTIGELDFVFRDEDGRLQHWETAVKFYLQTLPIEGAEPRYIGPNTSDTFERKVERLLTHQIPLGARVYSETEVQEIHMKGRIYYPVDGADHLPPGLAGDHLRGIWLRARELDAYLVSNAEWIAAAAVLKKPYWLTPGPKRLRMDEVKRIVESHFSAADSAMHLAFFDSQGEEIARVFVVQNIWPER